MNKAGDYTYRKILGQGTYGVVVEGYNKHNGDHVAIKIIRPKYALNIQLITKEFEIGKKAAEVCPYVGRYITMFDDDAPNIKGIDFVGRYTTFVVLEYIPGYTLEQYMKCQRDTNYNISPQEWCVFMGLLYKIMGCLHSHNIVHGDFNPGNIHYNTAEKSLLTIDFGGACYINSGRSMIFRDVCGSGKIITPPLYALPVMRKLKASRKNADDENIYRANDLYTLLVIGLLLIDNKLFNIIVSDKIVTKEWLKGITPFIKNSVKHYKNEVGDEADEIGNFLLKYSTLLEQGDYTVTAEDMVKSLKMKNILFGT